MTVWSSETEGMSPPIRYFNDDKVLYCVNVEQMMIECDVGGGGAILDM